MNQTLTDKLYNLKCLLGIATIAAGNKDIYADDGELACMLTQVYSGLEECLNMSHTNDMTL